MEAMGWDLVQGTIESLLKATTIRIGEEISLVWGLKADFKHLLLRAESKFGSGSAESKNPVFKEWVKRVAEVAYQAEDVIEGYAYEVLKRKFDFADTNEMQLLQLL